MLTPEENELLCRVEGDAPMGQLMRRYWLPACMIEEVAEPDGAPVRVRMLGEDLVAFRDTSGQVGVIGEHCPHRRASLLLGRNEECGLRCLYHGWKMDVDGNVVDTPSEPSESRRKQTVKHTAYPTREAGGFVWVYMGLAETMPEFAPPAFAPTADTRIAIVKVQVDCNWAQILEGAIDSAHSSTLHATDIPPGQSDRTTATGTVWARPTNDKSPRIEVQLTDYGMRYAAIRRPIMNADTSDYVRITTFVAPITVLIPPNNVYSLVNVNVPMDDTHTMFYFIAWSDWGPGVEQESFRKFCGARVGIDLDTQFRRFRTRDNNFLQDREAMKHGNHTGIPGIPNQDMAMWETMGPIADRSHEHLGSSDIAIVRFRKIMIDAVKRFASGGPPIGTAGPRASQAEMCSYEGIVPKATDWRTLGTSEREHVTWK